MKNKIFIAIDTGSQKKASTIITQSKTKNFRIGYKFGLEFMNSKNGRKFVSKLKNKIKLEGNLWISFIVSTAPELDNFLAI